MDKGIFLLAFGKNGYAYAAWNLLISLKHFNKDLKVALCCDEKVRYALGADLKDFDVVIDLKKEHYIVNGRIDPGKAKVNIYDYLPFKYNLFLDVDAIALQDVEPFLDKLIETDSFYLTQVVGKGGKKDKIEYNHWMTNEEEWKAFNLKEDAVLPAIQSSYCFIKKGKEGKAFFNKVKRNYEKFTLVKDASGFYMVSSEGRYRLSNDWGGTVPDELIFSATLGQIGHEAHGGNPIFFGNVFSKLQFHELAEKYYLMSIYGNGDTGRTLTKLMYLEHYDRLMERKYLRALNRAHRYKIHYIMRDKHANIRKAA